MSRGLGPLLDGPVAEAARGLLGLRLIGRLWRFVLDVAQGATSAGLAQMVTEPPGGEPAEGC